ncbi:hypothetical protein [Actinoplanes sp. NPDC026670]|uniref:hypothetical protein n=1 Tax=Actinoplanes sp. NPDC026670 TaxID=3154700 RepID=UPI0033E8A40A
MTELPLANQVLARVDFDAPTDGNYERPDTEAKLDTANLITSKVALEPEIEAVTGALHKVVLDIDLPVTVLPSSTPGHHHLFIDKPMTWPTYKRLLDALADAGLIESGYRSASVERKYTAVRLPWVKKAEPVPATPDTHDNLESF